MTWHVGDAELLVAGDGTVIVAESGALFDADEYDTNRDAFSVWPVGFLQFSPWHIEEGADGCADDTPFGVVNDDTDEVEGCHPDEAAAQEQIAALNANEPDADAAAAPEVPFTAVLAVEGFDTGDGRLLEVGGWSEDGRFLPLPLWVQTEQPEFGGHAGAFIGGRIETIERAEDGRRLVAHGFLSIADDRGQWAEGQIRSQNLRFVSIDVGDADVEYEIRAVDEEGWPIDVLARFSNYEIAGATVCGQPAINFATIWLDGMDPPAEFTAPLPDEPERITGEPEVIESDGESIMLLASAAVRDEDGHAPAEWFEDPELPEVTHVTVLPSGEVFGHLAAWGECHIGMPGCVTAPTSPSDYAHFRTGETLAWCDCDDGEHLLRIATGPITLGTGHAARGLTARESSWHYDHTGSAVADVATGEDEHGIWIHGAVRPGATADQIEALRAADVSGDWRSIGGALDLVAILGCNVAGFSIPRQPQSHLAASGGRMVQTSLVAPVGTPLRRRHITDDPRIAMLTARMNRLEGDLKRLRSIAEPLRALAAAEIVASIAAHPTNDDD